MKGELRIGEYHPAAPSAMDFVRSHTVEQLFSYKEAFASNAIEGSRMAEICGETLNRILNGQPVSDRYLLGLAWFMKEMEEKE